MNRETLRQEVRYIRRMQKHLFLLLTVSAGLLASVTAQDQLEYGHVAKVNPLGLLVSQYQLGYEHAILPNLSVQLSAGILTGSSELTATDSTASQEVTLVSTNRSGYILIPEVRWYPKGEACNGVYLALAGRFRKATNVNVDTDEIILERTANGAALLFGYQSQSDIAWEVFFGPQIKNVNTVSDYDDDNESGLFGESDGVGFRFGVNVGIGW